MSKEQNKTEFYNSRLETLEVERKKYSNNAKRWVIIRLLTFLAIPVTVFFGYPIGGYSALILVALVVLFLIFVRKSAENKERLNFVKHLIQINENELKALSGDYSEFSKGEQFMDVQHAFSYDMDVFGSNSFFPIFNRTVTFIGEKMLANKLLNGDVAPKETNNFPLLLQLLFLAQAKTSLISFLILATDKMSLMLTLFLYISIFFFSNIFSIFYIIIYSINIF
jgi:hypothetical protein